MIGTVNKLSRLRPPVTCLVGVPYRKQRHIIDVKAVVYVAVFTAPATVYSLRSVHNSFRYRILSKTDAILAGKSRKQRRKSSNPVPTIIILAAMQGGCTASTYLQGNVAVCKKK